MKLNIFLFSALAMCLVNTSLIYSKEYDMETRLDKIDLSAPPSSFSSGTLKSHSQYYYTTNRSKTLILSAPTGYGILAAFQLLDLRPNKKDTLVLFDKNWPTLRKEYANTFSTLRNREEFLLEDNRFYARSGQLGVNFTTGSWSSSGYDGFKLIFTVQGTGSEACGYSAFWCDNSRCISDTLKCDGHNNCGDRSDERNCNSRWIPDPIDYPSDKSNNTGRNIGIGLGVAFLGIAIGCGIYIVIRRRNLTRTEVRTVHPPPTGPGTYYPPPPPPQYSTNQGMNQPGFR